MTRQEVLTRIKNNENIMKTDNQKKKSINTQIDSLRKNIRSYNQQITDLRKAIKDWEEKKEDLIALKDKYKKTKEKFEEKQRIRLKYFNLNLDRLTPLKFMRSYANGMQELLSGNEFKKANNGLTTAIEIVEKEIKTVYKKIDTLNDGIRKLQFNIKTAENDIRINQRKISELDADIAYRRRRIAYWNDQLKYAT